MKSIERIYFHFNFSKLTKLCKKSVLMFSEFVKFEKNIISYFITFAVESSFHIYVFVSKDFITCRIHLLLLDHRETNINIDQYIHWDVEKHSAEWRYFNREQKTRKSC